ncbi:MAG: CPBP family intramembrane glutamic endopeptidase [Kineosporiaceae bacterium]
MSTTSTVAPPPTDRGPVIPQYSRRAVLAIWAAATLPMAALAWVIVPRLETPSTTSIPWARAIMLALTGGLIWQFVLVVAVIAREQRTLRWRVVREVLWLTSPRAPQRPGRPRRRVGGRVWLVLIPLTLLFLVESLIPSLPHAGSRDLGVLLTSDTGHAMFHGSWGWFAALLVMMLFNTVLGEELLFRGLLLPRMNGAFGRADWLVNGLLFAAYHLHVPWAIPTAALDAFVLAYPTKRYRSAWIGIAVHSTQSIFFAIFALTVVL